MMNRSSFVAAALAAALLPGAAAAQPAPSDTTPLSLREAVLRALEESEEVHLARAQASQASAQARSARSAMLPQVNTQIVYTKTFRSVFQGAQVEIPDSLRFEPDSTASLEERIAYLEDRTPTAALGALGGLFGDLPFGRENTWLATATLNQPLFTGGRIGSAVDAAEAGADAARANLTEAQADVALQVQAAYLGARLAQEAADIVGTSLELAREHLERVRLLEDAGRASELEVLRADVEVENLVPQRVAAENARELALLNLKRLVNLPADAALRLTTPLGPDAPGLPPVASVRLPTLQEAADELAARPAVRAAELTSEATEEQVDVARAGYLPSLALTGNFSRQAFPSGLFPSGGDWRDDWNMGLVVQWPLFQGFRRSAEVDAAQAQARQSVLRLQQLREGVRLEYEQALGELERARAQIGAAARTVGQAERVYELTRLRFNEGLATQLDVSDARLALQQARMNEAQAYHDFYLALARAERALGRPLAPVR